MPVIAASPARGARRTGRRARGRRRFPRPTSWRSRRSPRESVGEDDEADREKEERDDEKDVDDVEQGSCPPSSGLPVACSRWAQGGVKIRSRGDAAPRPPLFAVTTAALGVVFGDLGTSPLYAM